MPGWFTTPSGFPPRSNTSTTFDAFLRYVTAMRPSPNETRLDDASGRSGTTSRQRASSGFAALAATTRPRRSAFRRVHEERVADDGACRLTVDANGDRLLLDLAGLEKPIEVHEPEVVRLRVDPIAEHQPSAVARQAPERSPRRRQRRVLRLGELAEQELVFGADPFPFGGRAPGRCTDPSAVSGSGRRTPTHRAASRAPASCWESRGRAACRYRPRAGAAW